MKNQYSDDDDFEEQYIVSGPSPPVQFKSGPPNQNKITSAAIAVAERFDSGELLSQNTFENNFGNTAMGMCDTQMSNMMGS